MITLITGGLGTGKTCIETKYGITDHLINNNRKMYSNYHLKNYPYTKLDILDLYFNEPELKNITILGDELYTFMDCRCSMKERNRLESYFIAQTRKKTCNLFMTSQYTIFADYRLILFVNYHIKMGNIWIVKDINVNGIIKKAKVAHPYLFTCEITDYNDQEHIITRNFIFDGRMWFKEYDTDETIYPPDDYIKGRDKYNKEKLLKNK